MTLNIHLMVLVGFFFLLGFLNRIERRAARRTRASLRLRRHVRRFVKMAEWAVGTPGMALFIASMAGLPIPGLPGGSRGIFVGMLAGAYLLAGGGLLRLLPRFAELRMMPGGLWWAGRFIHSDSVEEVELEIDAIRVRRLGNATDLVLPSMLWDTDAEATRQLVGSLRMNSE